MANTNSSIRQRIAMAEKNQQVMLVCGVLLLCCVYAVKPNIGLSLAGVILTTLLTNRI